MRRLLICEGSGPERIQQGDEILNSFVGMSHGRAMAAGTALVADSGGMLGWATASVLGARAVPFARALRRHVPDWDAVARALDQVRPSVVLNFVAATDVDRCETNHAYADAVNSQGNMILAEACATQGVGLADVSTDFVFDGNRDGPYGEEDRPNPMRRYGLSKLLGKKALLAAKSHLPWALVVRAYEGHHPGGPRGHPDHLPSQDLPRFQETLSDVCWIGTNDAVGNRSDGRYSSQYQAPSERIG